MEISELNLEEVHLYYYWKNFAEATFMPDLALKQVFAAIVARTPFPVRFISRFFKFGFDQGYLNQTLKQHMQMIDAYLQTHSYVAGHQFSIAVFYCGFRYWLVCSQIQRLNPFNTSSVIYYIYKADLPFNVH